MKFVLSAALAASLLAAPCFAQQTNGRSYYQVDLGSGVGGAAHLAVSGSVTGLGSASASGDVNLKPGFFGSGALCYSFSNGLAAEVEGLYLRNSGDSGSIGTTAETYGAMGNLLYAIGQVGPIVPYVGAGIGYGVAKYSLLGGHVQDSGFMWQLRTGVSGKISETAMWQIGYRYLQSPDYSLDVSATSSGVTAAGSLKVATHTHVISFGVRQRF